MNTVNRVKHAFNPGLDIEGVLLTMLDARTNLGIQVVDSASLSRNPNPADASTVDFPMKILLSELSGQFWHTARKPYAYL